MKKSFDIKTEVGKKYSLDFVKVLLKNNFEVYLFGGALRDMFLGTPWKEADIRVIMNKPMKEREALLEKTLENFKLREKNRIESQNLTVYRFLPRGSAATAEIDLSLVPTLSDNLPDFTINSLFFDFRTEKIIDKFSGIKDIKNRLVRTVKDPGEQLKDEPHMMFRVIKFVCQYDFSIEPKTLSAIIKNKSRVQETFSFIADEKTGIFVELFLGNIFRGLFYNPNKYFTLLLKTGLYDQFIKFIEKRSGLSGDKTGKDTNPFSAGKKYEKEEALSIFLSTLAATFTGKEKKAFKKITTDLQIVSPKKYSDFVINTSLIKYQKR